MIHKLPEVCWCGRTHVLKCDIHGHQEYCHDEGDGWYLFRCAKCEEHMSSWCDELPKSYQETQHLRAMVVLADVLIKDSNKGGFAHQ